MTKQHTLWVERYRPQTIDEYVFHDDTHRTAFTRIVQSKELPHLLLSGTQGCGKTTIAKILIRAMELDDTDVLTINASDERGIDLFRETIKSFSTTYALGAFKIIHLEEADALTPPAQQALKQFMEEMSEYVRFIFTCNHDNKIIPPIKSRCQHFHFRSPNKDDVAEYLVKILANEHVKFNLDILDRYIAYGYPDIRKIVNTLQMHTIDGRLLSPNVEGQADDWKLKLLDTIVAGKWTAARVLVCSSVLSTEWESMYRFLYENLHTVFKEREKWEEAITIIAEHLYKHSICADPEINAAACFIRLGQL